MESDISDSSTSDEEYFPPSKVLRTGSSDESSSDECETGDDGLSCEELDVTNVKVCESSSTKPNTVGELMVKENEKKAKEDAVWNDFLSSVENTPTKQTSTQYAEVSRKYQFAGEEICITERVAVDGQKDKTKSISSPSPNVTNGKGKSQTHKTEAPSSVKLAVKPAGLSSALSQLKSLTGSKAPKLSTLEKSRMDWQNFVQVENIEHDLKAHNKGKQGYLERRAFMDRAAEREYTYQKSQTNRKT